MQELEDVDGMVQRERDFVLTGDLGAGSVDPPPVVVGKQEPRSWIAGSVRANHQAIRRVSPSPSEWYAACSAERWMLRYRFAAAAWARCRCSPLHRVEPAGLARSIRGASFVEYIIAVGAVALLVLGGFGFHGRMVRAKASRFAECVESLACASVAASDDADGPITGQGRDPEPTTSARPAVAQANTGVAATRAAQSPTLPSGVFDWVNGALNAFGNDMAFGLPGYKPKNRREYYGAVIGHIGATLAGLAEMIVGGGTTAGGGAVTVGSGGTLALGGVPAAGAGVWLTRMGAAHTVAGAAGLTKIYMEGQPTDGPTPSVRPSEPRAGANGGGGQPDEPNREAVAEMLRETTATRVPSEQNAKSGGPSKPSDAKTGEVGAAAGTVADYFSRMGPRRLPDLAQMIGEGMGLKRPERTPVGDLPPRPDPKSLPRDVLGTVLDRMGSEANWSTVSRGASNYRSPADTVRAEWAKQDAQAALNHAINQLTPEQRELAEAAFAAGMADEPQIGWPDSITLKWVRERYPNRKP
jgi:hypothetical protein